MIKIISISDLHGKKEWITWCLKKSVDYDVVLFPGDLIDMFRKTQDEVTKIELFLLELLRMGKSVGYCSGNHDAGLDQHLRKALKEEKNIAFDGETLNHRGLRIKGHPYMCANFEQSSPSHIWLYHVPPEDRPIAQDHNRVSFGDFELASRIEYTPENVPPIVICGHQHSPSDWKHIEEGSLFLNSGQKVSSHEPHFLELIIDLKKNMAEITQWPQGEMLYKRLSK